MTGPTVNEAAGGAAVIRRSHYDTTDPEAAHAMVAATYADHRLRVTGSVRHFRFEQSRLDLGAVRVDGYHNTVTTEYELQPLGTVLIARVLENAIDCDTDGLSRRLSVGDIYMPARPDRPHFTRLHGARVQLTSVDVSLLQAVDPDHGAERIARLSYAVLDAQAGRRWQQAVDYVTGLAAHPGTVGPLVLAAAARVVAATLLEVFAPDSDANDYFALADARPATVRRAIAYIETNPDLDIAVADIARAAHVSVRALQLAFRQHLNTTPTRYLRRVRLDLARADLQAAVTGPGGVTVADIGMRWGYLDLSRFATDYRAVYGENPHVTLRGGRSR